MDYWLHTSLNQKIMGKPWRKTMVSFRFRTVLVHLQTVLGQDGLLDFAPPKKGDVAARGLCDRRLEIWFSWKFTMLTLV